jgi:hypothetical protein
MSFQYSLNNLRTNSPYYSLNNLNTENGIKIITADLPVVVTQSGGSADISLFQSSENIIDFGIKGLNATTGTFTSINSSSVISPSGSFNKLYTDEIQFNTNYTPTIALPTGYIYWDNSENRGTLSLQLDNDISAHLSQDVYFRIKATEDIPKGKCVQFNGTLGASGIILAKIATGTNLNPQFMMGVSAESILKDEFGFITHFGFIRGIDTSLFPGGSLLYFNGTGGFTNIEPTSPQVKILMCAVVNQGNSANGSIFVRPSLFPRLADINGVALSAEASKDLLIYDTNRWINQNRDIALNGIVLASGTISNLTTNNLSMTGSLNTNFLTFTTATGINASITNINNTSFTGGFMNFNTGSFSGLTGGNLFVNNLSATNSVFSASSMNAPNANISCFAVSPTSFVFSPFYTGARAELGSVRANSGSFNNISATGMNLSNLVYSVATGGNLFSNVFVKNGQVLQFNQADNSQIVRIEPGAITNNLSFFNAGNVLQTLYTTTSSGANVDNLNNLGTKDITNLSRIRNGNGTQALPSYSFVNDTDTGLYTEGSDTISLGLGNRRMTYFQPNLVSFGSGASNGVSVDIYGTLQVGGTSNANSALIDLGYSGSIFGVNNSRMGYITTDGATLEINHQQSQTGSTSVGQIQLTPANNSTIRLLKQANGILSNISRNDGYAHQFANLQTGGLGMLTTLTNKPDGFYVLATQGIGFRSAHTFHCAAGNTTSNLTLGLTNFPFSNNEFITARPFSLTGSTSLCMKVANQVNENNGFGCFGQFSSGTTLTRNHTYISNSAVLGGISFHTNDTSAVPSTYPKYLIDVSGNHYFSVKSATGVFEITSQPFAVGIGESFTRTCGNGRFLPVARGNLNNTSYTGGSEFIARGTADSNNDHSAYTSNGFSADHKGFYRIMWNINGSFATSADTLFIRVKVAGITKNVCTAQFPATGQLGNSTGYALVNVNASDDIELYLEPDTRLFTCANDGYFLIEYVG